MAMTTAEARPCIYETIGRTDSVRVAVDQFCDRVLRDGELTGYFVNRDLTCLKAHQRGFLAATLAGTAHLSKRSMRDAHAQLHIQPEHYDRIVEYLVETLAALGVPALVIGEIAAKLAPPVPTPPTLPTPRAAARRPHGGGSAAVTRPADGPPGRRPWPPPPRVGKVCAPRSRLTPEQGHLSPRRRDRPGREI